MTTHARTGVAVVLVATLATLTSAAFTRTARADDGAGAIRLAADLHVLNLRHYPNGDLPDPPDPTIQFGLYNAVGGTEEFLFFAPQLGYLIDDSIVVGAHLGFAVVSFNGSDAGFGIHLVPFFEYMFGAGGNIRPFIGAEVGPRIFVIPTGGLGGDTEYVNFVAGGFGGVHIFVEESFSVSPFGSFDFLYNSQSERAGYEFVVGLSLMGWIGGGSSSRSRAAPAGGGGAWTPPPADGATN